MPTVCLYLFSLSMSIFMCSSDFFFRNLFWKYFASVAVLLFIYNSRQSCEFCTHLHTFIANDCEICVCYFRMIIIVSRERFGFTSLITNFTLRVNKRILWTMNVSFLRLAHDNESFVSVGIMQTGRAATLSLFQCSINDLNLYSNPIRLKLFIADHIVIILTVSIQCYWNASQ